MYILFKLLRFLYFFYFILGPTMANQIHHQTVLGNYYIMTNKKSKIEKIVHILEALSSTFHMKFLHSKLKEA